MKTGIASHSLATTCLLLSALSCTRTADTEPAEVRAIIEAHNAKLEQWYAKGEIDSVATVFAEDAWQMPPNSPPLVGRVAIHDFWSRATGWGGWNFDLQTEDVVVAGPAAIERGSYSLEFAPNETAPEGMAPFRDTGNYIVYWRLDPHEGWRIVWDAPVSTQPLPTSSE
ncbi:MAG TPA: DUF4440 domain-containing protein [Gemmatimonadota bacterium]|nr:DUF4440 domain-containing protein [Gemmatimonadota bacterium]